MNANATGTSNDAPNRRLGPDDATAVKLALLAILACKLGYSHRQLDEAAEEVITPFQGYDEALDALERLRLDGKPIIKVERVLAQNGEECVDIECLLKLS